LWEQQPLFLRNNVNLFSGTVGFSSQVPWIFNGNIEENIIFNRPMDKERLSSVIEACYLTRDLEELPNGKENISLVAGW